MTAAHPCHLTRLVDVARLIVEEEHVTPLQPCCSLHGEGAPSTDNNEHSDRPLQSMQDRSTKDGTQRLDVKGVDPPLMCIAALRGVPLEPLMCKTRGEVLKHACHVAMCLQLLLTLGSGCLFRAYKWHVCVWCLSSASLDHVPGSSALP